MVAAGMSGKYPTMKIVGGSCCHSLAIVVMAQEHGEDDPAVKRAHELYQVSIPLEAHIAPIFCLKSTSPAHSSWLIQSQEKVGRPLVGGIAWKTWAKAERVCSEGVI